MPLLLFAAACQNTVPTTENTPNTTASAAVPAAELRGTRWVLHALAGQAITPTDPRELYLQLSATEQQVEGQASCNRFRGAVELPAANQLRFGPLMSTRMACPDMALETGFVGALNTARSYQISGDTLRLYGEQATTPLAELHRGR
ncbi:META domain-containing protein [Hymenobacter endophyticus]|uniref:META domain-containing protein n=1 Tax=Hymenobacter endophyticus TaxID=3076335 RepID=A0ABU3TJH6_9BACT|nr:META domain-containing protein [Hymenobacter endophyticus]MDU0371516.1 META domain-containing protein [Hymenobacter endophyticus]